MTYIKCPLAEAAIISPRQTALYRDGLKLSYHELNQLVSATEENLKKEGFKPGEHVGLLLPLDWDVPILFLSLLRLGAVVCPLSTRLPREGLRDHLQQARCTKLIGTTQDHVPRKHMWGLDIFDAEGVEPKTVDKEYSTTRLKIPLDQLATLFFTSGSTGQPKAAMHTYGQHYYSALGANQNIRLATGDRWLLSLPLYHVGGFGIMMRCLEAGAALVLADPKIPLNEAIQSYGITHLSLVATQLYRLLHESNGGGQEGLLKLKAVLLGGGEAPISLVREARQKKIPLYTTYGLTEMGSQVTTLSPTTPPAKQFTAGCLLNFRELAIADDQEILVKGDTLFSGYFEGGELQAPVTDEGWFHTGDLGQVDEDGYLTVTGRKDNMFISGGENVHPEEIERVIGAVPSVSRSVVVPVFDEEFGHRPVVFIQTQKGIIDSAAVREAVESVLPKYKIPVTFLPWPKEQDIKNRKIDRTRFRDIAEQACA